MIRLLGLIAVLAIGVWSLEEFGGFFGLSQNEAADFKNFKNSAIDRAAPVVAPIISKQGILDADAQVRSALPTAAEVTTAMETQFVPAVINAAKKIGEAAKADIAKSVPPPPAVPPAVVEPVQAEPSSVPVYAQ